MIDRALYLPRPWTGDPDRWRGRGAGRRRVRDQARPGPAMISQALAPGCPASWVAGDEVYGADPELRDDLARRGLGYVLAVAKNPPDHHRDRHPPGDRPGGSPAETAWQRLSAGRGAKGARWYDWALIDHRPASDPDADPDAASTGHHWLLIRRNRTTGELRLLPRLLTRPGPAGRAGPGRRTPLDDRGILRRPARNSPPSTSTRSARWTSWHRWTVLAMLAHAFLSVMAATNPAHGPTADLIPIDPQRDPPPAHHRDQRLCAAPHTPRLVDLATTDHQARARTSHYQRQADRAIT